jgi:hypothetical protein
MTDDLKNEIENLKLQIEHLRRRVGIISDDANGEFANIKTRLEKLEKASE